MNRGFIKPETILKRSEDLLALGGPQSEQQALDSLTEVFQSNRFKKTPLPVLEPIILKLLQLCTSLRKNRLARDALGLYKIAAQQVSIPSIELVLKTFIQGAEEKLKAAQDEAKEVLGEQEAGQGEKQQEREDEDDLELPLQPDTLLFESLLEEPNAAAGDAAGVDGSKDKDRVERKIVTPWLRFAWEAYKTCLEVCKSNARLEVVYQQVALQAFGFCRSHSRKSEFRRLTEQLRKDLLNAQKYASQAHSINFSDPDTFSRFLDTRFQQLEVAVELELWQEAFRSVEDIHGLLMLPAAKKGLKREMMANYYEKLTRIFKAEGGTGTMAVFHAAAWARYLQHAESASSGPGGVNEKAPGAVLLSALAVPLSQVEGVSGEGRNGQRLMALLNLNKMPTRQGMLREITNKNILHRVPSQLVDLYNALEVDFHPLTACKIIAPLVDSISKDEDYAPYIRALKPVVLARLLQSLSEVYSTISISYVMGLVKPFASGPWATNEKDLETFLMGASQRGELGVAVDHISKAITFQHEQAVKPVVLSEVSNLQDIAATGQTSQIARLALALQNTIQYLNPSILEDAKQARAKAFARALAEAEDERKAAVHRQAIVDRRRQKLEEINSRRLREENDAKVARAREAAVEAAAREAEAYKQREKDRVQKEIDTIRNAEAKKLAETLKARGGLKVDLDGVEDLDTEKLLQLQSAQIAKEQKNIAERMRIISKRVDHLERAFRKEERPLLEDDYEKQKQADKDAHKAAIKAAQQAALEKHHLDLALKERLSRMLGDYQSAKQIIESARQEEFAQRKAEADKKIAEEKKAYRAQVLKERAERRRKEEQERQAREQAEREEEERAAAEAEAKAAAAAKAEADAAAAAERRAAREAERQKDIEAARKRVEEEEERERRRAERSREGPVRSAPAPAASSSAPGAEGGRRRLQLAPRTQPVPAQAAPTPTPAAAAPAAAPARAEPAAAAPPAARAPAAAGSWAARREAATPAASTPAPPVFKAGAGGGWREREAARKAAGGDAASDAPPASTGGYRPPARR
ncbi:hypothetical protein FFLO_05945 [Filobasidium floriforme]|uniref:Eukaryotic translation initiation factor 3 subunit A n=1 Tax=Filobasidium floriforme TaxID=5210 RepID=A0A8K0NQX8_9TREE|nr:uncharacterized protein HD553DRAFT_310239 [Filobasidium floriforme]KAG7528776.1 hypothetical protein FFLO_05945 [Filobasidium floriforme]KAH8085798.1 hypothetical protein HD553DRAFT_310239 [Filobasidium floriforme]